MCNVFNDNVIQEIYSQGLNQAGAIGIAQCILDEYCCDCDEVGHEGSIGDYKEWLSSKYEQSPYDEGDWDGAYNALNNIRM